MKVCLICTNRYSYTEGIDECPYCAQIDWVGDIEFLGKEFIEEPDEYLYDCGD
jgi:hypothetical protein